MSRGASSLERDALGRSPGKPLAVEQLGVVALLLAAPLPARQVLAGIRSLAPPPFPPGEVASGSPAVRSMFF